jgi:hypothetical protein
MSTGKNPRRRHQDFAAECARKLAELSARPKLFHLIVMGYTLLS